MVRLSIRLFFSLERTGAGSVDSIEHGAVTARGSAGNHPYLPQGGFLPGSAHAARIIHEQNSTHICGRLFSRGDSRGGLEGTLPGQRLLEAVLGSLPVSDSLQRTS